MTAPDLETWLHSLDRSCLSRVLSAYGYPVVDTMTEEDVRDALRESVLNGAIDLSGRVSLAA